MRRAVLAVFVCSIACSGSPEPAPTPAPIALSFTVVTEGVNRAPCVESPEFAVARDEDAWIDIFDRQTGCLPDGDFELPNVDFRRRFASAAWWKAAACEEDGIATTSVSISGGDLVLEATSSSPGTAGCTASTGAQLESILTIRRAPVLDAVTRVRFVLDGAEAGAIPL